jgi:hypothetical protein
MNQVEEMKNDQNLFVPHSRLFILIGNEDYEARRQDEGYGGFVNLPAVKQDL